MAFRPPKKQPKFADLNGILAQSKNSVDNSIYQTIQIMIERLTQFQQVTLEEVADVNNSVNSSITTINNTISGDKTATYLTTGAETFKLPNSVQLLAGTGIAFDDTVANQRTISSSAISGHYDSPLSDGDLTAAELIFADGECIIVQVPV